jgi:hypothetical protein
MMEETERRLTVSTPSARMEKEFKAGNFEEARRILATILATNAFPSHAADTRELWGFATMFNDAGDQQTVELIADFILKHQITVDPKSNEDALEIEHSVAMLLRLGQQAIAGQFADALERRALDLTSKLDPTAARRLGLAANVALKLSRKRRARDILREATLRFSREEQISLFDIPSGMDQFDTVMDLARIAIEADVQLARKFLEMAGGIAEHDPRFDARAIKYAAIAGRWASLGDYLRAREAAENAAARVTENRPPAEQGGQVYFSNEIEIGGVVGGYLTILDARLAQGFSIQAHELGATQAIRRNMPGVVSITDALF